MISNSEPEQVHIGSIEAAWPFHTNDENHETTGGEETNNPPSESSLDDKLRAASLSLPENEWSRFIPADKLEEILTETEILKELRLQKVGNPKYRELYVKTIWNTTPEPMSTSRRKIFAILVLTGKVEAILDFIEQEIYDNDLPLLFQNGGNVCCKGNKVVKSFNNRAMWNGRERDSFDNYQCWMLTPCFQLSCERLPRVNRYVFENRAVLPITKQSSSSTRGGNSTVRRVKFHPAHYNSEDFSTDQRFAIKTLHRHSNVDHQHNQEVKSLVRLNQKKHKHLIRLLLTFEQRDELHLVFPWASGNLQDFWLRDYPDPQAHTRHASLALWVADQCLGLAQGLETIHNSSTPGLLHLNTREKNYGRHGDLKPENILHFLPPESTKSNNPFGVLKISDFGMVDFHRADTKSGIPLRNLGMTPTYRAPEWDIMEQVAQSYDLWCMGCVILEFIEWYLNGKQGVEDFSHKRMVDSITTIPNYREDNFFNAKDPGPIGIGNTQRTKRATAKTSVKTEIDELKTHERSSDFVIELLDIVEKALLRMSPKRRAKCDELVEQLKRIHRRCSTDTLYCTDSKVILLNRPQSILSELEMSDNLPNILNQLYNDSPSSLKDKNQDSRSLAKSSDNGPKTPTTAGSSSDIDVENEDRSNNASSQDHPATGSSEDTAELLNIKRSKGWSGTLKSFGKRIKTLFLSLFSCITNVRARTETLERGDETRSLEPSC